MLQGTVNQEVPITKKKEVPPFRHLSTVLGQCQRNPGTVLDQNSLETVLGQWSWDSGLGTVVLGQWSWDSGLGTVVLGQGSWDRVLGQGLGTVVLGQWSWDKGLGTGSWDKGLGTVVL